jgi:hypothetical protein
MRSGYELPMRRITHGIEALVGPDVNRVEAQQAIAEPHLIVAGNALRLVPMSRHDDAARQRRS